MQLFKISCLQCPHYDACPQKTRMFVNYCGSKIKTVEMNIREAISVCRSKRGFMLKSDVFISGPENQTVPELNLSAATS
jgi:hypothetical protein